MTQGSQNNMSQQSTLEVGEFKAECRDQQRLHDEAREDPYHGDDVNDMVDEGEEEFYGEEEFDYNGDEGDNEEDEEEEEQEDEEEGEEDSDEEIEMEDEEDYEYGDAYNGLLPAGPLLQESTMVTGPAEEGRVRAFPKLQAWKPAGEETMKLITQIMDAAKRGCLETCETLVAKHSELLIAQSPENGGFMAHFAALGDSVEVLEWLVKKGQDLRKLFAHCDLSVLHVAAEHNAIRAVQWLCSRYPELEDVCDVEGRYPYHVAAIHGGLASLAHLIQRRVEKNLPVAPCGAENYNVFDFAVIHDRANVVQWFVEQSPSMSLETNYEESWRILKLIAESNAVECLNVLMVAGLDPVHVTGNSGTTCASIAAQCGSNELLSFLAENFPSLLTRKDVTGIQPAHFAAMGEAETLEHLGYLGVDLYRAVDERGYTIAMSAAESGSIQCLDWIHTHFPDLLQAQDLEGFNIMDYAILSEDADVLDRVVELGFNVSKVTSYAGITALMRAAEIDSLFVMSYIMEADPSQMFKKTKIGRSVASYAAETDALEALTMCIQNGLDPTVDLTEELNTIAHYAAYGDGLEVIKYISATYPFLMTQPNKRKSTPLHLAASSGAINVVQFYIEQGIDLFCRDSEGLTPFLRAVAENQTGIISLLCNHQSMQLYTRTAESLGALHVAAMTDSAQAFERLTELGLNPSTSLTCDGLTPFMTACQYGEPQMIQYIASMFPELMKINTPTGAQPLHYCALSGSIEAMHEILILMYEGVDLTAIVNEDNMTALMSAAANDHHHMVSHLHSICPDLLHCKTKQGHTAENFARFGQATETLELIIRLQGFNSENINSQEPECSSPVSPVPPVLAQPPPAGYINSKLWPNQYALAPPAPKRIQMSPIREITSPSQSESATDPITLSPTPHQSKAPIEPTVIPSVPKGNPISPKQEVKSESNPATSTDPVMVSVTPEQRAPITALGGTPVICPAFPVNSMTPSKGSVNSPEALGVACSPVRPPVARPSSSIMMRVTKWILGLTFASCVSI